MSLLERNTLTGLTATITVAGNGTAFRVENGGDATLIAGHNILFRSGTTVLPGP